MANDFHVSIFSPSEKIRECRAQALTLPGSQGYMTILPDHAQMVAELDFGEVKLETAEQGADYFFLSGGFVEIQGEKVTVLADVIESAPKIDVERARASRERALRRLAGDEEDIDVERANRSLRRAETRMLIAQTLAAVSK